jgi:hypothetical protein
MHFKTIGILLLLLCGSIPAQEIPRPPEVDAGYKIVFSQFYLDFDRDNQNDILIVWEKSEHHVLQIWSVIKKINLLVHDMGTVDFQPSIIDFRAIDNQFHLLVGNTLIQYSAAQSKKKQNP